MLSCILGTHIAVCGWHSFTARGAEAQKGTLGVARSTFLRQMTPRGRMRLPETSPEVDVCVYAGTVANVRTSLGRDAGEGAAACGGDVGAGWVGSFNAGFAGGVRLEVRLGVRLA